MSYNFGLIIENEYKFILCKTIDGKYNFPNGNAKENEDGYSCSKRVFVEKTRLTGFSYLYDPNSITEYKENGRMLCVYFNCTIREDTNFELEKYDPSQEIIENVWLTYKEILELPNEIFLDSHKELLKKFYES